jgi:outer membrane receptor protein involved in Fe transport
MAVSVTNAVFTTRVPGVSHFVPNVPPVLLRIDVTARGRLTTIWGKSLSGRVGVGYTFLSGRYLTDTLIGPTAHALNAGAGIRYDHLELGVDAYNLLNLRYADDAERYISNWGFSPAQQRLSTATHMIAAPPATVLGTASLHF